MTNVVLFEGADGSGKSLGIKLLKDILVSKGKRVLVTGALDYELAKTSSLYDPETMTLGLTNDELCDKTAESAEEAARYYTSVRNLIAQKIVDLSLTDEYDYILVDRWTTSSYCYQGDFDFINESNKILHTVNGKVLSLLIHAETDVIVDRLLKKKEQINQLDKYELIALEEREKLGYSYNDSVSYTTCFYRDSTLNPNAEHGVFINSYVEASEDACIEMYGKHLYDYVIKKLNKSPV